MCIYGQIQHGNQIVQEGQQNMHKHVLKLSPLTRVGCLRQTSPASPAEVLYRVSRFQLLEGMREKMRNVFHQL